ncbi:MAG: cyclic nucleotide-binding domain-containing protein [Bdellovibrionaceae bacterium]|nr:cyclic nucleotide-binding domain-containing protein [Pseudobdellovibrionaceae bacterium]
MFSRDKVQEIEFQAGDIIIREGSHCDALVIIKSGQVEIFKTGYGKKKILLGLVQSGEYLGEMALISDRPHSATAIALTKTICIKITSTAIDEHLKNMPSWLVALTRGLVYKLNKTNEVLKRNGIQDDNLSTAVKAITDRESTRSRKLDLAKPPPIDLSNLIDDSDLVKDSDLLHEPQSIVSFQSPSPLENPITAVDKTDNVIELNTSTQATAAASPTSTDPALETHLDEKKAA